MKITTIPILLLKGLSLFFILPLCFASKRFFDYFWRKYYMSPLKPNMFNLCVQWLLHTGDKLDMDYNTINVAIFCIVWPIITIVSIALNIILLLWN